jgi:hypothetical protein
LQDAVGDIAYATMRAAQARDKINKAQATDAGAQSSVIRFPAGSARVGVQNPRSANFSSLTEGYGYGERNE